MGLKKSILGGVVFLLLSLSSYAQELPENRHMWREQPLQWEDFQGTPEAGNPFHANTSSGLSYGWSLKTSIAGSELNYEVESFFNPDLSWVKPGSESLHLLAHEQLHFDITELHARKLRAAMEAFDVQKVKDVKQTLKALYQKIETERREMQERFDAETKHSQEEEMQLKWQRFIKAELEKLSQFSSDKSS